MTGSDIVRRFDGMNEHVGNWKNLWQECADWCLPLNDNINHVRTPGVEKPPQRLIDIGIEANYSFASGFFSHLFPPGTIWARYKHPLPPVMKEEAVAQYFEEVSRIVHNVLVGSNFATEEFQSLLSLGAFGTSDVCVEEDEDSHVRFRNYQVNTIRILENDRGIVDTVARQFPLTPRQAIQKFGREALEKADLEKILLDNDNNRNTTYEFIHYIEPRSDADPERKDASNKPWASYYVCRDGESIVSEGGFDMNPHKPARFMVGNNEVYGRSPAMMVLASLRRANVVYRATILSYEQSVNNQWLVRDDDDVAQRWISQRANAMIKYRAGPGGPPQRLDANGNPLMGKDLLEYHDARIRQAFFNHLFRPLEEYRNMSATEVNERMTTDLMHLAPFASRYIDEKVTPLMEHVFYICQKRGLLPPVPRILAEDPRYEIEYVGRLALATKSFEMLGSINTMRIMADLGGAVPQMMSFFDNIDADRFGKDLLYANSASMASLKDPEVVEAQREAAAQAMENQQAVDNAAPIADAVQKLSGKVDPTSVVNALAGGAG